MVWKFEWEEFQKWILKLFGVVLFCRNGVGHVFDYGRLVDFQAVLAFDFHDDVIITDFDHFPVDASGSDDFVTFFQGIPEVFQLFLSFSWL